MKKIFTLAAAVLFATSIFAGSEISSNTGTANTAVEGTSYTIPGAFVAGAGGKQVTPMPNKGIKVRLNSGNQEGGKSDTLLINVNEGYKIIDLTFTGVTNSDGKAATIGNIAIDGVDWNGVYDKTLPAKDASAAANIALTGINASQSILFAFSELNGATQANICLEVTYEITATTYKATYKSNLDGVNDSIDNLAIKVKDNVFREPNNKYFVGWNTKADGTGDAVAVDAALSSDITLYAQWEEFEACVKMAIDSGLVKPAKDVEVALKEGSVGGKMIFVGAKEDNYEASFIYKKGGALQLSKGGADSLRVELNAALVAGQVIRLELIASKEEGEAPSINMLPAGSKTPVVMACNVVVPQKDTVSVYYVVKADDNFAGSSKFILQRGSSTVILNALEISNCAEAPKSSDTSIKSLKINNVVCTAVKDTFFYEVAANEDLAAVAVEFELNDAKAKANRTSPFQVKVPNAEQAPVDSALVVTAEDNTEKTYTIRVSRKSASAPLSNDATIKSLTINNVEVAEKDGVFAYEVENNVNLAEVEVAFVLNEVHAKADKENPFKLAVPASSESPASEATINVTAEDGTTKKAYKVSVTRKPAEQGIDDVLSTEKATKVLRNGMLLIEKNGVLYNAQGVVVR